MNNDDKAMLYVLLMILSPFLLVIVGVGVGSYIQLENKQQIILECIKQAEIQDNPICLKYIKK